MRQLAKSAYNEAKIWSGTVSESIKAAGKVVNLSSPANLALALSSGQLKVDKYIKNGKEYLKVLGKSSVAKSFGLNARRYLASNPAKAIGKFVRPGIAALRNVKGIGIGLATSFAADLIDYSPIGLNSNKGYGTEFAAAVTVDVGISVLSIGVGALVGGIVGTFAAPGVGTIAGAVAGAGAGMAISSVYRESWINKVENFYNGL